MDYQELHQLIENIFVCELCRGRLLGPVFRCEKGHIICLKCTDEDVCGEYFAEESDGNEKTCNDNFKQQTLLNDLVKVFIFTCKFSNEGCKQVGIPCNLRQHERVCNYRYINCIFLKNGSACNENISIPEYGNHIDTFHDSYVVPYSLNSEYSITLPKRKNLENNLFHFRVLKDNNLYFLEMIYYDDQLKAYQISVHLIGIESEAANYIYSLKIKYDCENMEHKYSSCCLANILTPEEVRMKKSPFLLFDINRKFSVFNEVTCSLKIMKKEDFCVNSP